MKNATWASALDRCWGQSYQPLEIIVADEGSRSTYECTCHPSSSLPAVSFFVRSDPTSSIPLAVSTISGVLKRTLRLDHTYGR
jgi:hypothetical protein